MALEARPKHVDDRTFVTLAKQHGRPSMAELRTCQEQQRAIRKDEGRRVTLFEVACAHGIVPRELLQQLSGSSETRAPLAEATRKRARTGGGKTKIGSRGKTKIGSRGKTQVGSGGKTQVGSGKTKVGSRGTKVGSRGARSTPRRRSGLLPLLATFTAVSLGCVGLAVWVGLKPRQTDLANEAHADVEPDTSPLDAPQRVAPAPSPFVRPADAPRHFEAPSATPSPVEVAVATPAEPAARSTPAPTPATPEPQPEPQPEPAAPQASPAPKPEPTTLPGGIDLGETTVLEAAAKKSWDAQELLFQVYQRYDDEDLERLGELIPQLEALGARLPETLAGTGLHHFLRQDYPATIATLEQLDPIEGWRERDALARAHMFLGQFADARALLGEDDPDAKRLARLLDGPFRERYPLAAAVTETVTPEGHYRVVTDLGLDEGYLDALEERLEETAEGARAALVEKAREKHKGLHEVAAIMDKAYKAYAKLFAAPPRADVVPTVYVFSQEADFHGFSSALQIGSTENTLGYYMPRYRVLVFYDMENAGQPKVSSKTLNVLMHETFHQWLHLYVDGAPHWFNEGMAEYFGISRMTRKTLHYGLVPQHYPSRLDNIRWALTGQINDPLPLRRLLQAEPNEFMSANAAINYAHAWSFVHFLANSGKKGRDLLRGYFRALQDGLDIKAAYKQVFGDVDMVKLEARWKEYVFALKK